jgi:hypothetical protein
MTSAIRLLAGPGARERIARDGLQPGAISAIGAAAGGPKGLALLGLDEWLFGDWLRSAPRPRLLAGASIGAWRMAAAVHPDGVRATQRLGEAYLELQRYSARPDPSEVAQVCRAVAAALLADTRRLRDPDAASGHQLAIITARARGPLAQRTDRRAFARCAWANLRGRHRLGRCLQRVVFGNSPPPSPPAASAQSAVSAASPSLSALPAVFEGLADGFDTQGIALTPDNLEDALLASGSIPLICEPVRTPDGAPPGLYWDGGLIDYHLHLPWHRLEGLVLVPHFTPWLTPGWLDKGLPWRRRGPAALRPWLDNVLLIAPSAALLARLPGGKLPDRQDFQHYGLRHDERIQAWRRAMQECQAMVEDVIDFVRQPDPARLEPL